RRAGSRDWPSSPASIDRLPSHCDQKPQIFAPHCGPRRAAMHGYMNKMRRYKFPLFPAAMLALESNRVVALRLMKLAAGGRRARAEASRMVSEKISEAVGAGVTLMTGGSSAKVIASYRKRVRANARRLSARRR